MMPLRAVLEDSVSVYNHLDVCRVQPRMVSIRYDKALEVSIFSVSTLELEIIFVAFDWKVVCGGLSMQVLYGLNYYWRFK
jgi:hypothetical protein